MKVGKKMKTMTNINDVIDDLTENVTDVIDDCNSSFTGSIVKLVATEYDSYIVCVNMYGFIYDIIFEFDARVIYIFSHELNRNIMKCDVLHDVDTYDFIKSFSQFALIQHACDSTGAFELL